MKPTLDESMPIFQQIAQIIRIDIVEGKLLEEERVPSENEISNFYNINRATVRKGLQTLVDEEIIYKKRGIGMFVMEGAKEKLLNERKKHYKTEYIWPLLEEGKRLGMSVDKVIELIKEEVKK
ncbi:DNA-binding transcriptional regulator YhcF (GntR family) [Cytobacillus horneckiae]|uniref:GntR family transcriptional regulator n=1 Tax=Cytobacillus horneckiae TaxID=549687 RepID=A0A2N0ZCL3_9BACI|nr:GntR family transcriptional regulator [Cytobacillus horneckiae]NRG45509.1 GntR family transcriptional regulator [Bacillus sp. CRN 9]MBN6885405.1 GntR family transcriptional regulator [Cytobacillus horneckiae]MCM3178870.1 GntR family transcriptional regulator [Cytobacillus horneckiae]MEC1158823.1 GntR family transcriptional regulator [Cytobacillus horneckiae]MED2937243.1 GntR family transcriptional regulator [Cytobacillus horneckiae]